MNKSLGVIAAMLSLAAIVWLAVRSGGDGPGDPLPRTPIREEDAARAAAEVATRPASVPHASQAEAATSERKAAVAPTEDGTATVRGRCVATSGAPLAGCELRLQGFEANTERMEKHVAARGAVQWTNPPAQTTGADGLFSFTFVPPPPYQFALEAKRSGVVTMQARWSELPPGTKDVGDVVMRPGALVTGRVVDTDAAPQEKIEISLGPTDWSGRDFTRMRLTDYFSARSGADGTFRFGEAAKWSAAGPGDWISGAVI